MFNEEQLITMQWVARNKKRYESLGYNFTKLFEPFEVKAKHLPKGSEKYVDVVCDYCGETYRQQYKHQYYHKGKDCCKKCWHKKFKETMADTYGVEHALQFSEFVEKYENTCLNKFGCKKHLSSPIVREKIINSYYQHGTCPTSAQQIKIGEMLYEIFGESTLNYPCGDTLLDCVVCVDGIKVDVEYDGTFWHTDSQKDRRRDEFVKSQGYKVLRIKSRRNVPQKELLQTAINNLVKGCYSFKEIILDI